MKITARAITITVVSLLLVGAPLHAGATTKLPGTHTQAANVTSSKAAAAAAKAKAEAEALAKKCKAKYPARGATKLIKLCEKNESKKK